MVRGRRGRVKNGTMSADGTKQTFDFDAEHVCLGDKGDIPDRLANVL